MAAMTEMAATTWRELAACKGKDPDIFFPERGDTTNTARAKAICATCPVYVKEMCLREGVKFGDPGVRGGLTTRERQRLTKTSLQYHGVNIRVEKKTRMLTVANIPSHVLKREGRYATAAQVEWFVMLRDDGWTLQEIADAFGYMHGAVRKHLVKKKVA